MIVKIYSVSLSLSNSFLKWSISNSCFFHNAFFAFQVAIHLTRDGLATNPASHRTFGFVKVVVVVIWVLGLVVESLQVLAPHFYRFSFFLDWFVFSWVFH